MDSEPSPEEIRTLRRKVRLATLDALHDLGGRARRSEIREHVLTQCDLTERERSAAPPESWTSKYPTLCEALISFAPGDLKRDGLVTNPSRGMWLLTGAAAEAPEPLAVPVVTGRLQQLRSMDYDNYLRTPEWRETRGAALVRYGHSCALDATHVDRLEVHHRDYNRRGEERVQDVIVLCHECHVVHHKHHGRPGSRVEPAPSIPPPGFVADVETAPKGAAAPHSRSVLDRLLGSSRR